MNDPCAREVIRTIIDRVDTNADDGPSWDEEETATELEFADEASILELADLDFSDETDVNPATLSDHAGLRVIVEEIPTTPQRFRAVRAQP